MTVTGKGLDFQWYRYTDNGGGHWSMRVDAQWGAAAASGFATFNSADPVWPKTRKYRARAIILQDTATGRKTELKIGSATATAYAKGQTVTRFVRGLETAITFTVVQLVGERQPGGNALINSFPEYTAAV